MAVTVAQCQTCGEEITTDDIPQPLRLYVVMAILMVHAAMIHNLMQLDEYAQAKPGWDDKMDRLTDTLDSTAEEMGVFGDHFDG
jgi:hypothetical protein